MYLDLQLHDGKKVATARIEDVEKFPVIGKILLYAYRRLVWAFDPSAPGGK